MTTSVKRTLFVILTLGFILLISFTFRWLFYTDRLEYKEISRVYDKEHQTFLVGYLGNCGATCSWTVKVDLEDSQGKKLRNRVYYSMHCGALDIKWINGDWAVINHVTLNVYSDHFDARNEKGSVCPN
jgi:hypothetical protein